MRQTPRRSAAASTHRTSPHSRLARAAFEALEDRRLFSAALTALLAHPTGTITGRVFVNVADSNNTAYEADDTPVGGQPVYVDLADTGAYVPGDPTATTAADGTYTIGDVLAGTVTVRMSNPDGLGLTEPFGSQFATVAVGGTAAGVNFGVSPDQTPTPTPAAPLPATGTITGSVFSDLNDSGTRTGADPALAGITAFIDPAGGGTPAAGDPTTTTAADGTFSFADVPLADAGDVHVVLPAGSALTAPGGANAYLSDNATTATAFVQPIGIAPASAVPAASPFAVHLVSVGGPKTVLGGVSKTVRFKVTNTSAATVSGPVLLSAYASPDPTATAATAAVANSTEATLTLKPGQSKVVTAALAYPQSLASGKYHTGVSATPTTGLVAAATATSASAVTVLQPDVVPGVAFDSTAPVKLKPGRRATVAVRVTNNGTVPDAVPYTVSLETSTESGPPTPLSAVTRRLTLRPGQSAVVHIPFTAPDLTPGTYSLYAIASVADAVDTTASLGAFAATTA